jgi:hypothetical protein
MSGVKTANAARTRRKPCPTAFDKFVRSQRAELIALHGREWWERTEREAVRVQREREAGRG